MIINDLRVQDLKEPLGIESRKPVFGYLLESEENNQYQSAFHILVASSPDILKGNAGDLWDSGKQDRRENYAISYAGEEMKSRQIAYWKVKVWDKNGIESEWSNPSFFEMGLLNDTDWKGVWIGQGDSYSGNKAVAPMFIGDFETPDRKRMKYARLYISGLGLFKASLNGRDLSDTLYDPGESDATKTVYYVTYDVTDFLVEGANTLGVMLGNGQYTNFLINPVMVGADQTELPDHRYQKNDGGFMKPGIYGDKKLIAQLEIHDQDGHSEVAVASSQNFRWKESPTIFQNWYGGEDYDATLEQDDWNVPHGSRKGWLQATEMEAPGGRLTAREYLPIKIVERIHPKSLRKLSNGNWIVDMGQNAAGFPELTLDATEPWMKGTWVRMYPAELLKADGNGVSQASCTQSWNDKYHCSIVDSYRIKGCGQERWHPLFSYQGFQYIEVVGFPGEMTKDNITFCVVRTANDKNGSLDTSNASINQINKMIERSMESNMFSCFTDCPQIEKLGWIETSHLMFRSLACTYDISAWMRKIIHDITDSQIDEAQAALPGNEPVGYVPAIIPEYQRIVGLHKDPNWSGACIFTPWEHYSYYGDIAIFHHSYPVMKRYINYLTSNLKDNVLKDYAQMGEWGELRESTPAVLVATCSYYRMLEIMERIALLLQLDKDAIYYHERAEITKKAFHENASCFDPSTNVYGNGSQASYGCVLYSRLVPEDKIQSTVNKLIEAIIARDYHLSSGEIGLKQVFCALGEYNRSDVVYRMIMNETSPSYRFFVDAGLTALPEYWNCDELWHGMERSRNHAMMGHAKEWLVFYMLGIRPAKPAFREVIISSYIPAEMQELKGSIRCPYGRIAVEYTKTTNGLLAKISVPVGVKLIFKKPYTDQEFKDNLNAPDTIYEVGSGYYEWFI